MKQFIVFSLLLLLFQSLFAQKGTGCKDDLLPKLGENRSWGYVDFSGTWIIEPYYAKVSPFVEGKAIVQKGILMGVIDCEGRIILPCKYERLTNFRNGKAWAQENGKWGLVGAKGQIFQAAQFEEINPIINTELAWIRKDGNWGLFNEDKNSFTCAPKYKIAQVMSMNASLVSIDKTYGVLNHVNCDYLLPLELTKVRKVGAHDIVFQQNGKWGVFNDLGKTIMNPEFDSIYLKNPEVLQVKKGAYWGLYGLKGKKIMDAEYEEIGDFSEVYYTVKKGGKYGYANRYGKLYIKPQFDDAGDFRNRTAVIRNGSKYGVIDATGKYILPADYSHIAQLISGKHYAVKKDKSYQFTDDKFKAISSITPDSVYFADSIYTMRVKENGKVKYYNVPAGTYVSTESFDKGEPFFRTFALVDRGGKKGVLSSAGPLVIPTQYDQIEMDYFQSKMVFRVVKSGKEGIADATGKMLIPVEYDLLVPALPSLIKAKKNGKFGIIRTSGEIVVPFEYDYMSTAADLPDAPVWPAIVSAKGKFGLINEKGEPVFEIKSKEVKYLNEGKYLATEGKKTLLVNTSGTPIELNFDEVGTFNETLAAVKKGGKWGYITADGKEKIPVQFESAGDYFNKKAVVKVKGLYGVIDRSGKFVMKAEYQEAGKKKGKRYLIKDGVETLID
jgi:hypothetical protein